MLKVIFTCGGTAGHVNPAIALAGYMQQRHPDMKILFVGTPDGMEKGLVEKSGYTFRGIEVGSFLRSPKELKHNLHTAQTLITSRSKAMQILNEFQPDLVVGTGGYASFPMVRAAAHRKIPTAVHESNMVPGLTTKMLESFADKIMVGFEECRQHYRHPEKIVVTGTPVRGDFFTLTKEEARAQLGITDTRPLVISFWGSLGASTMNAQMLDYFRFERDNGYPFHHIHAVGASGWEKMQHALQESGITGPEPDVRKYIYNMAVAMRAADLVISRAGASTISELTALGMPTIMVPSPYVTNNHQEKNARILEEHGGAEVILEKESTPEKLFETTMAILTDPQRRESMQKGMAELGILDSTVRIYQTVTSLLK